MKTYITKDGDQWDIISKKFYDNEKYIDLLIENNINYIDIFQFPAGVELKIPDLPDEEADDLPAWRR